MSSPSEQKPRLTTCRCQHCGKDLEIDATEFAKGETRKMECPHCRSETGISQPAPQAVSSPVALPPSRAGLAVVYADPAKRRLQFIREHTCYPSLRKALDVGMILGVAGSSVAALACFADHNFVAGVAFLFCIALVQAARLFFVLLVDIADSLLHDQASKDEGPTILKEPTKGAER